MQHQNNALNYLEMTKKSDYVHAPYSILLLYSDYLLQSRCVSANSSVNSKHFTILPGNIETEF